MAASTRGPINPPELSVSRSVFDAKETPPNPRILSEFMDWSPAGNANGASNRTFLSELEENVFTFVPNAVVSTENGS